MARSGKGAKAPPELKSIRDFIRHAVSRFEGAGLAYGHGCDNALDEASFLVLRSLHLPPDLPASYGEARLLADEKALLAARIEARVASRKPTAYLLGEAWFAGIRFAVDERVLVPRSPIAELIDKAFAPFVDIARIRSMLDLCCGSGCIGLATALRFPGLQVTLADLSPDALAVARTNAEALELTDRVRIRQGDLLKAVGRARFDLIVANPPYVGEDEYRALPPEYHAEPALGLTSGRDGLDLPLRILAEAPAHLTRRGCLILEVGASQARLMAALPELPGIWVDFERGGDGVLAITREELTAIADDLAALRQSRA